MFSYCIRSIERGFGQAAPGFFRALFRAVFGTLGTLAAGLGLLFMIFDPARRALHDRLFRTRVIRI